VQRSSSARELRGRVSAANDYSTPIPDAVDDCSLDPVERRDVEAQRLAVAVGGLLSGSPDFSAATGLRTWQKTALGVLIVGLAASALLAPEPTIIVLLAVMAVPFLMAAALRAAALWHVLMHTPVVADDQLPLTDDAELPSYSVLVPLFREGSVVPHLLRALRDIDYPYDKMDVLLIVESIDQETQAALANAMLAPHMRVVVVPDGEPRTKPRALQYALQLTRGEYVVVFDAEDAPECDQLRRAAAVLGKSGGRLGCLQAQLNIYNSV
jgi:glycosyltransferase XagB